MRDTLDKILSKHTGQPLEKVRADTDRDFFMSGEDAKKYGIVDEVIVSRGSMSKPSSSKEKKND